MHFVIPAIVIFGFIRAIFRDGFSWPLVFAFALIWLVTSAIAATFKD